MNALARNTVFALAFSAALSANAAETPPPSITIDCAHPALPSQAEVASLTGMENFGQAYAERTRLMQQAVRACRSGVAKVVLVRDPQHRELPQVARTETTR